MIRHIWTVVCSKSVIDRESNNLSLFEVLEAVQFFTPGAVQFPASVPFDGRIVSLWARSDPSAPCKGHMQIRFLAPDGKVLLTSTGPIDLSAAPRFRVVTVLPGISIAGSGKHEWEISSRMRDSDEWEVRTKVPLEITLSVDPERFTPDGGPAHLTSED